MNTLKIPALSNHWIGNSGPDGRPWNVAAVTAWLCSDLSENLNGRELYINGGHVALVQELEFVRSPFAVEGWTFEGLCDEGTTRELTWDIRIRFTGNSWEGDPRRSDSDTHLSEMSTGCETGESLALFSEIEDAVDHRSATSVPDDDPP